MPVVLRTITHFVVTYHQFVNTIPLSVGATFVVARWTKKAIYVFNVLPFVRDGVHTGYVIYHYHIPGFKEFELREKGVCSWC
jgi:hypothetical protein